MRTVKSSAITEAVKNLCIQANYRLSPDMEEGIKKAFSRETNPLGKEILQKIQENLEIAGEDQVPICQDTGMAVVFLTLGQDVHVEGDLREAVNEGIRQGYEEGYLRKSIVKDPFLRENTGDNTPGILHIDLVPGDQVKITVAPKGFGSENMSRVIMCKPSDGREGVKDAILKTVEAAGPNACPPLVVGVGIGGTFEYCTYLAKKALTRELGSRSPHKEIAQMEEELLLAMNELDIGPGGLGGRTTVLGVQIETYPTHIAGLPVAVNLCCHVNRHASCCL